MEGLKRLAEADKRTVWNLLQCMFEDAIIDNYKPKHLRRHDDGERRLLESYRKSIRINKPEPSCEKSFISKDEFNAAVKSETQRQLFSVFKRLVKENPLLRIGDFVIRKPIEKKIKPYMSEIRLEIAEKMKEKEVEEENNNGLIQSICSDEVRPTDYPEIAEKIIKTAKGSKWLNKFISE